MSTSPRPTLRQEISNDPWTVAILEAKRLLSETANYWKARAIEAEKERDSYCILLQEIAEKEREEREDS